MAFFGLAALACLLLSRRPQPSLDYEDSGDPVVRTLNLTPQ
jgi:hypothetical protein